MRALLVLVPLALLLAGCTSDDPEESTDPFGAGEPEESTEAPPIVVAEGTTTISTSDEPLGPEPPPAPPADPVTTPPTEPAPTQTTPPPPAPAEPAATPPPPPAPEPTSPPPPASTPPPPPPASPTPPPPSPTPPPPSPTPPPPEDDAWPQEGSFARFAYRGAEGVPGYTFDMEATLTLTYRNGAWTGICEGERRTWVQGGGEDGADRWDNETFRETVALSPLTGPMSPDKGESITMPVFAGCHKRDSRLVVEGMSSHTAPRHSQPIDAWYGHYTPGTGEPYDARAWWDDDTGLVLAYDVYYSRSSDRGWLVDTDAPLK